jgi:hypothetical protein
MLLYYFMEMPTYEEHKEFYFRNNNIVEVSSSAFLRVALEYGNPFGVAAFSVVDNKEPFERFVFIDKELFARPTLSNPNETYEELKPFCIEHEITENYELLKERIDPNLVALTGIDNRHDELARHTHLKLAHEAGLLDKMLEFHVLIQMTCQYQIESMYGRPHSNQPDNETLTAIKNTFDIAERIRNEQKN